MVWLWFKGVFTFQYDMGPKQIWGTNVKLAKKQEMEDGWII
jgi:hypothetical protein